jgi:hypothetical protein
VSEWNEDKVGLLALDIKIRMFYLGLNINIRAA